ncbi:hypothetical protein [Agromyces sp. Marseille-P2726]|uniref:hypothetical protein n=1 Tax=Agromyces sp. Marseille-P2726 TaxID=2709132 RepID=UPI00156E1F32|nr:hypothetical protein [Agromyces sp. Marseille-P2726]
MAEAVARPVGVSIVAVLALISGVVDIINGVLVLLGGEDAEAGLGGSGGVLAHSIGSMVLGLVVVVLALGLWTGWGLARMIVTVLQALSLIHSLFLAVAYLGNPVGEWASVLLSAVVLILLWTRPASSYFRSSQAAAH